MTYAALQWSAIDVVATELADRVGCVLVRIHLDESEAAIGLESCLGNVAEVLEQRDKIVLSRIWRQIANVARCLPLWGLVHNHFVGLRATSREGVVAIWSGWSHAHLDHCLLL